MKLISDVIEHQLENLYGLCFTGNAICDNMVTQLNVKFVMPQTSKIIHYHLAHIFPNLADSIADYAADRNSYLHRPPVAGQLKEYNNLTEMFKELLDYLIDFERAIYSVCDKANEDSDRQTVKYLDQLIRDLRPLISIALGLCDYVEMNGDTPPQRMQIDSNIEDFLGFDD